MSNKDKGDYDVGYRKPPKNGRFQKGKSGNPHGRPKKEDINPWETLMDILGHEIQINGMNGPENVSYIRAIMLQMVNKAARGDNASIKTVFQMLEKITPPEMEAQQVDISTIIDRLPN